MQDDLDDEGNDEHVDTIGPFGHKVVDKGGESGLVDLLQGHHDDADDGEDDDEAGAFGEFLTVI